MEEALKRWSQVVKDPDVIKWLEAAFARRKVAREIVFTVFDVLGEELPVTCLEPSYISKSDRTEISFRLPKWSYTVYLRTRNSKDPTSISATVCNQRFEDADPNAIAEWLVERIARSKEITPWTTSSNTSFSSMLKILSCWGDTFEKLGFLIDTVDSRQIEGSIPRFDFVLSIDGRGLESLCLDLFRSSIHFNADISILAWGESALEDLVWLATKWMNGQHQELVMVKESVSDEMNREHTKVNIVRHAKDLCRLGLSEKGFALPVREALRVLNAENRSMSVLAKTELSDEGEYWTLASDMSFDPQSKKLSWKCRETAFYKDVENDNDEYERWETLLNQSGEVFVQKTFMEISGLSKEELAVAMNLAYEVKDEGMSVQVIEDNV